MLTLVQFDDKYQTDYECVDVNDVKPLDESSYSPRGGTALLDAVGKTVNMVRERLAKTDEEKRPGKVIFLIITDGQENSSKEFKADTVKEMVKHQIENYNWTFVYLGGGDIESQKEQGLAIGVAASNVYGFSTSSRGMGAVYGNIARGVSRRRTSNDSANDALLLDRERDQLIDSKN